MSIISKLLDKALDYHCFRVIIAKTYPVMIKLRVINLLQRMNKGSFGNLWAHEQNIGNFKNLLEKYPVDFNAMIKNCDHYHLGFIYDPIFHSTDNIIESCEILKLKYTLYNIFDQDLYYKLRESTCDALVIFPSHDNNLVRSIFHEVAHLTQTEKNIMVYPTVRELNFYEAKRTLYNFMIINDIPHPKTAIFYDPETACRYLDHATYPLIFKTHIGASSSGVEILENKKKARKLANRIINKYYLRKLEVDFRAKEWGYFLIQDFIKDAQEFRIIKIGDSWFGWQKWKNEEQLFMSGSGVAKNINPSERLLNFCYEIAERFNFTTMSFDVLQDQNGKLVISELQTWFGSYNPSQLYLEDGTPGRYQKIDGKWVFEPGVFNIKNSLVLRLVDVIKQLEKKKSKTE